jgi:hypothetical protein
MPQPNRSAIAINGTMVVFEPPSSTQVENITFVAVAQCVLDSFVEGPISVPEEMPFRIRYRNFQKKGFLTGLFFDVQGSLVTENDGAENNGERTLTINAMLIRL